MGYVDRTTSVCCLTKEINIMVLENYHKTENQISNIIRLYTHLKRRDPPV